jgi:hypothetical protein
MKVSQAIRGEMMERLRWRYERRARRGKQQLLDDFCEQWGYSRKHAIKLLRGWRPRMKTKPSPARGRPRHYDSGLLEIVQVFWAAGEQMCGKRLAAALPQWLPHYQRHHGKLSSRRREELLRISPASLDRLLAPLRVQASLRGLGGTKPGTLLKRQIAIQTESWDEKEPGFLEADTVAHCGESLNGDFIWSVTFTDIASEWTETGAVWNKGAEGVLEQTRLVEGRLPFALRGFDCDNGSEFLNWHLVHYLQERDQPVRFTRSRPYHKDDNGHVEQKNWTHVRQLLGYERLENRKLLEPINELYRELWAPWHNFFFPSMKLVKKYREGSRWVREHDQPQTPYHRLLDCGCLSARQKRLLRQRYAELDPFVLKEQVERKLAEILLPAARSSRPTGSLRLPQATAKGKTASN